MWLGLAVDLVEVAHAGTGRALSETVTFVWDPADVLDLQSHLATGMRAAVVFLKVVVLGVAHRAEMAEVRLAAIVRPEMALQVAALVEDLVAPVHQARELVVQVRGFWVQNFFSVVPIIRDTGDPIIVFLIS